MNLVHYSDPILTTKCELFDFLNPPFDPVEFSHEIMKYMYEHNGIGLAANQIGIPYRIFAMRGSPENFVCFNPRIIDLSEGMNVLDEACLSYPGLAIKVKRPHGIKVRFQTPNGEVLTKKFGGMTARIFQHEMDHLDGDKFFDKANRYHRDKAFKKWHNIRKD